MKLTSNSSRCCVQAMTSEALSNQFLRACTVGDKELVREYKEMTTAELNHQFVRACTVGDKELVRELLLNPRVEVNSKDVDRTTPLMFAVIGDHLDVVHLLLGLPVVKTKPSHINSVSRKDKTSLILACEHGYHDIVSLLLYHPDIDPKANIHALHNGALRAAVRGQHEDCVRLLLRAGADTTNLTRASRSPRIQRLIQYSGRLCGNPSCQHTSWQTQSPTSHTSTPSNTPSIIPLITTWQSAPSSISTTTAAAVGILPTGDSCFDSTIIPVSTASRQQQQQLQQQQWQQQQLQQPQQQQQPHQPLRACSRCHITAYCSVTCSKMHWKAHKTRCTPTPPSLG